VRLACEAQISAFHADWWEAQAFGGDMAEVVSKVQIFDEFLPLHHQLFAKIMKIAAATYRIAAGI
jgi:hypothetical protein